MNRKFESYDLDDENTVQAHRVTEDTAGEVTTPGHIPAVAVPGDVLVSTNHPDVVELHRKSDWDRSESERQANARAAEEDVEMLEFFEPADHTATEVRRFLAREDVPEDIKSRVREAEVQGKNRQSALA